MQHVNASCRAERRQLRGIVMLELLLALPVVLLFLLALIQFALIYEVDKRVAYASRFGAKLASETIRDQSAPINLATLASSGQLRQQIDRFLDTAGLGGACGVILEHNACLPNPLQADVDSGCACPAPTEALPGGEPDGAAYVRVTVCLPLAGNVCDLLPSFGGFSVSGKTVRHSTTFRIERDNQSPAAVLTVPAQPLASGLATPALPLSSPPTGAVTIALPNTAPATLTLGFNGSATTDPEQPLSALALAWAADADGDGTPDAFGGGVIFSATFTTPAPGSSSVHAVRLTATDGCLDADTAQLLVTLTVQPP